MKKLKTYDEFVNEGIMDVIKTPIKYVKIKNNLKKYQKAKVKQALNDVDFAKRKAKGRDEMTDKQKEVLTQANKAKNAALADTTSAISQRMNDLATSPILKKVVSLGTTKARLAANDVVFKSADGEEKKKLKIKANELQKKAAEVTGELKDYESTAAKKEEPAKVSQQNTDDIKTSKPEKEETKKPEKEETTTDANADKKAKLEADIKDFNDNIEAERSRMTKAMKDLDQAKRDLKTGRGSEEGVQKIEKSIEDSKEDIAELKKKEADAKKKLQTLGESFEYVAESVSQKFARLRNEM
jgi:chromosome segregation ATPase|tara:strand:- start:1209 stop:2102 length:894 start_codon:yes stop_codon:yes gene_type:complete